MSVYVYVCVCVCVCAFECVVCVHKCVRLSELCEHVRVAVAALLITIHHSAYSHSVSHPLTEKYSKYVEAQ